MLRLAVLVLGAATLVMSSCAEEPDPVCTDTIVTRAEPTNDFTVYQTFAVVPESEYPTEVPPDLPPNTSADLQTASAEARRELLQLGLTEVDFATGNPDVVLFTLAATDSETGVVYECVPGYYWYGWWGYVWDPCAWLVPVPVDYAVATVLIGLADPADEAVVFGGAVQGILECGNTEDRIEAAVDRIFDDYPANQTGG